MTGRTTRIAALGAGTLLALGIFSAGPAGASDGAQADATVQTGTAVTVAVRGGALALARTDGDWAVAPAVAAAGPAGAVARADVAGVLAVALVEAATSPAGTRPEMSRPGAMALTRASTPAADTPMPVPSLEVAQLMVRGAASSRPDAEPSRGSDPSAGRDPVSAGRETARFSPVAD